MTQFRVTDTVWLTYPNSARRAAIVREVHADDTVTVAWRAHTPDRGRPNRRRAKHYGPLHIQRVSVDRLLPREV